MPLDGQRDIDMEIPALADHADRRRARPQEGGEAGVVGRAAARAARHAEGDELGGLEGGRLGEEGVVGGIGPRPAALDIVDPQAVQGLGDGKLVPHPEIDALGLGAIPSVVSKI